MKPVMAASKLRSLANDPDYYTKAFKTYAVASDKTAVFARWGEVFGEAVVPQITAKLNRNEEFRVLAIGSGTGMYRFNDQNFELCEQESSTF